MCMVAESTVLLNHSLLKEDRKKAANSLLERSNA